MHHEAIVAPRASGYAYKVSDDVAASLLDVLASRGWTDLKGVSASDGDNTLGDGAHNTPRRLKKPQSLFSRPLSRSQSVVNARKRRWHLYWKTTRFTKDELDEVTSDVQRINHFARTSEITKKDTLIRILRRMKAVHRSIYNFFPESYILPGQYSEFARRFHQPEGTAPIWIIKPCASSQGRDIYMIRSLAELKNDSACVAQRYLQNCLTISGYKFDLRIYVLVTSFHPLRVYIYRRGLCRFSSERYDLADLGNLFSHLTNSSINRHSPSVLRDKSTIGIGCKWTLWKLLEHLRVEHHVDIVKLWKRMKNIVLLTLLPLVGDVPASPNSFELFGFDIMLDQAYKPWLLEVNSSPAIAAYGKEDTAVKYPMLNDLLDIVGFRQDELHNQILAPRLSRSVSLKHTIGRQGRDRPGQDRFKARRACARGANPPQAKAGTFGTAKRTSVRRTCNHEFMQRLQSTADMVPKRSSHQFSAIFTSVAEEARSSSFWKPFAPKVLPDLDDVQEMSVNAQSDRTPSSCSKSSVAAATPLGTPPARMFGLFEEVYPWPRAVTDRGRACLAVDSQSFSSSSDSTALSLQFRRDVIHELKARSFARKKVAHVSRRKTVPSFAYQARSRLR